MLRNIPFTVCPTYDAPELRFIKGAEKHTSGFTKETVGWLFIEYEKQNNYVHLTAVYNVSQCVPVPVYSIQCDA